MANFILTIHHSPYAHQSSRSGYQFAQAAITLEHRIKAIFFYEDGVMHALKTLVLPSNELNGQRLWINFTETHDVPLLFCAAAGEKRGLNQQTVHDSFNVAGLTDLVSLSQQVDRVIQFK